MPSLLRYHLYHPIVRRCVAGQEEQRAGLAIGLNRHLAALVTRVQYDFVDVLLLAQVRRV